MFKPTLNVTSDNLTKVQSLLESLGLSVTIDPSLLNNNEAAPSVQIPSVLSISTTGPLKVEKEKIHINPPEDRVSAPITRPYNPPEAILANNPDRLVPHAETVAQSYCASYPVVSSQSTTTGCAGVTGANGSVTQVNSAFKIPDHMKIILGSWRGTIGDNLVMVRFEVTSETGKLLAWYTRLTLALGCEDPELLCSRVTYNQNTKTLAIEDPVVGPFISFVTDTQIIGKLGAGGSVMLVR